MTTEEAIFLGVLFALCIAFAIAAEWRFIDRLLGRAESMPDDQFVEGPGA